jgi:predicted nuclease of restriction endonuclease-like (RecB) superfamily
MKVKPKTSLYGRIREILEAARAGVARSVNTAQVVANWLIGREIVEEEQKGRRRAGYGEWLMRDLAAKLREEYGNGYGLTKLKSFKQFYLGYPRLAGLQKGHALRGLLLADTKKGHALRGQSGQKKGGGAIFDAVRQESDIALPAEEPAIFHALRGESSSAAILPAIHYAPRKEPWQPGQLHSNLSRTHYRTLLRVDKPEARAFYEIEAIKHNWSARELERQINSLLYERLTLSKDKKGLMRLATKGHEIAAPADVFKDPVVIEFLGLPESPRLVETKLEEALINNLQAFLLELGKGFAFVARQERITLDGDHFYVDLVFYHTVLKCYVLIDLKVGKLTHQDLGQLQLYANYFDRERRTPGDNPTLGLILCTDKNDAVVRYTLGSDPGLRHLD